MYVEINFVILKLIDYLRELLVSKFEKMQKITKSVLTAFGS